MCECPCVLRPFFGQCIFNIIFAAPAYPLPHISPPLPSQPQLPRPQFFQIFYFWLLFIHPPHPDPARPPHAHWQQPCLQWACMYFFHIRHGRVLGVGRRPLATVRFAGGLTAYAKCSQRFCIYIFPFLFPTSPSSFFYSFFFVAFKLSVEVKRTLGRGTG